MHAASSGIHRAASGVALTPAGYAGPVERSAEGPTARLEIPAQLDGLSNALSEVEALVEQLLHRLQPAISSPPPSTSATAAAGQVDQVPRNGCGLAGTIESMRLRSHAVACHLSFAIQHLQF